MAVWENFTSQKQWKAYLQNLMKYDDNALLRAIVLIYENQTDEEKTANESFEDNHIGFSMFDAKEMGYIARKIKSKKPLTEMELAKSRIKMPKYWRQLMVISKRHIHKQNLQRQEFEQQCLEELLLEVEEREKERIKLENFRQHNETLRRCAEEGKACDYGICDECMLERVFRSV